MRNKDLFRIEFRQYYIVSLVNTCILALSMVILYVLPRYANILYYKAPANISESDISIFKGLFSMVNVLFIVGWLLASAFNKASITDMDLDPEDLELEIDLDNI
mmetsp:Transcript_18916/g.18064  ORF Transcript_18916/g.18064 Transcript_18916/m.18064 type:complete len:104 (+) Transcript_18916:745-1056(+)